MPQSAVSIFSDYVCELGEGPVYDPESATLFWFDIVNAVMLEKHIDEGTTKVHALGQMASAMAVIDGNRQLVVTETGLHIRDRATGSLTMHTPVEAENTITRSNDARVHPCGALWFSTMGKNVQKEAGAIYWFFRGSVRTLYSNVTIPNSIAFSADGTIAYYADTASGCIMRVACDPVTGLPTAEPHIFASLDGNGGFDGSVVDADGTLWNARWGEGRLVAYEPGGRLVQTVQLPVIQPTCPAFIGKNAERLAVTSAWLRLEDRSGSTGFEAGQTLALDLPVRGRFEPKVLIN